MGFKFHHVAAVSSNNIRRAEQSMAFSFKPFFSHCCSTSCPGFGKTEILPAPTCETFSVAAPAALLMHNQANIVALSRGVGAFVPSLGESPPFSAHLPDKSRSITVAKCQEIVSIAAAVSILAAASTIGQIGPESLVLTINEHLVTCFQLSL